VRGAFFDSVADRVTDGLVLGGVAWYLQSRHHGMIVLLPMAVLGASLLISYERAKAESLGFDAKGGLMERAERVIVLCLGLLLNFLLVPLLWVMLALTLVTAVQRFVKVWRQATAAGVPTRATTPAPPPMAEVASARWRAWREANGSRPGRFAHGTRRSSTWRERRAARFGDTARERPRRPRSGSRRP
jgi:CDP-diacylglycerol--glycerol-3-phosphate 3-phosphatidyltransferase